MKTSKSLGEIPKLKEYDGNLTSSPRMEKDISSSLAEFLEKERIAQLSDDADTDIGSIIEEINRISAQSPLGPYEKDAGGRSIEEIMQEAEKVYMESSKSFEQLSMHSKTSMNVTDIFNNSESTPKSASPIPTDSSLSIKTNDNKNNTGAFEDDLYSDDFTGKSESVLSSPSIPKAIVNTTEKQVGENVAEVKTGFHGEGDHAGVQDDAVLKAKYFENEVSRKEEVVQKLEDANRALRKDVFDVKVSLNSIEYTYHIYTNTYKIVI